MIIILFYSAKYHFQTQIQIQNSNIFNYPLLFTLVEKDYICANMMRDNLAFYPETGRQMSSCCMMDL